MYVAAAKKSSSILYYAAFIYGERSNYLHPGSPQLGGMGWSYFTPMSESQLQFEFTSRILFIICVGSFIFPTGRIVMIVSTTVIIKNYLPSPFLTS